MCRRTSQSSQLRPSRRSGHATSRALEWVFKNSVPRIIANQPNRGEEQQSALYQHTVFCQTYLPPRNPRDGVRNWMV